MTQIDVSWLNLYKIPVHVSGCLSQDTAPAMLFVCASSLGGFRSSHLSLGLDYEGSYFGVICRVFVNFESALVLDEELHQRGSKHLECIQLALRSACTSS